MKGMIIVSKCIQNMKMLTSVTILTTLGDRIFLGGRSIIGDRRGRMVEVADFIRRGKLIQSCLKDVVVKSHFSAAA